MSEPPLQAVGLDPATPTTPAGGATGRLWRVQTPDGPCALRLSYSPGELVAMRAARQAGLPVPDELAATSTPAGTAMLLSWLPGVTLVEALQRRPERAEQLGAIVGAAQLRLHEIPAPAEVPSPNGWMTASGIVPPDGDRLLHLDWHWRNVLVDDDGITAILDWENARRGPPVLDLARTHALFTVEPTLAQLPADQRRVAARFAAAWAAGYGPEAGTIPDWAHAWAGAAMLADLERRYAETPRSLDHLRAWTAEHATSVR
jgi:aminoglycoside phosphotransferase (APT) family kinase protein